MQPTERGYRLTSGREFYACLGVLGLLYDESAASNYRLVYGFDGHADIDDDKPLTPEERREIAEYAITEWREFAGMANECDHLAAEVKRLTEERFRMLNDAGRLIGAVAMAPCKECALLTRQLEAERDEHARVIKSIQKHAAVMEHRAESAERDIERLRRKIDGIRPSVNRRAIEASLRCDEQRERAEKAEETAAKQGEKLARVRIALATGDLDAVRKAVGS